MRIKNEATIDRRILKTKRALTEALIHLILEKGYEKVTIQDIIDKANIGRSTFYIHYESKEQLLLDGHNNLNIEMFPIGTGNELNFENLFSHIAQNSHLAKAMLGKNSGNIMTDFFKHNIAFKIRKQVSTQFGKTRKEQKMLTYLSGAAGAAIISLLVSWLEDDMPFSIAEMSDKCQTVAFNIFNNTTK